MLSSALGAARPSVMLPRRLLRCKTVAVGHSAGNAPKLCLVLSERGQQQGAADGFSSLGGRLGRIGRLRDARLQGFSQDYRS